MNFMNGNITNKTSSSVFSDSSIWTIYGTCTLVNIIIGLPMNSYVLWLIFKGKGNGLASDFFILNLTGCEFLFSFSSLIGLPLYMIDFSFLMSFISALPIMGRPLFLCLICVDRYLAVVHPVTFLKFKPLRYRLGCSTGVWVIVISFGVFQVLSLCLNNVYSILCIISPNYTLLLFVKLYCCIAVLRALKRPGPGERGRQREEANLMKRRAMSIILIVTISMIISYTPLLVAGCLFTTLTVSDFFVVWSIGVLMSMLVGLVKSFLYIRNFGNLPMLSRLNCNILP